MPQLCSILIVCLQFLGFTVVVFSWPFWKGLCIWKSAVWKQEAFWQYRWEFQLPFSRSSAPTRPFLCSYLFSSIFWASKWFCVYSLPLLLLNGTPTKGSLLLNICLSLTWVQWQRIAFFRLCLESGISKGSGFTQVMFCTLICITIGDWNFGRLSF